jgi:hypothetical protein
MIHRHYLHELDIDTSSPMTSASTPRSRLREKRLRVRRAVSRG